MFFGFFNLVKIKTQNIFAEIKNSYIFAPLYSKRFGSSVG